MRASLTLCSYEWFFNMNPAGGAFKISFFLKQIGLGYTKGSLEIIQPSASSIAILSLSP
jgi:hypothetical protein